MYRANEVSVAPRYRVEQVGTTTMFHYWADLPNSNALGQQFLAGAGPSIGDEYWHAVRSNNGGWDELEGRDFAIEITAVPEPGTWLLLSAGFGLIALGKRRHAHP